MAQNKGDNDEKNLEAIKRLLVFMLSKEGVVQRDLAKILQMSQSEISKKFYLFKEKEIRKRKKNS